MHELLTLPRWVRFVAQDADGQWWGYEAEPHQFDHGWYENEVGQTVKLEKEAANPRWRETLTQLNKS